MARRKDRTRQARGTAVPVFRTATYARLSVDSGTAGSDSIASQQMLMRDFLKGKEEFALVREYMDDGVSGTRFDRQALECLLSDVRKGKINCIVVKDFSRFGRDHIEVGNYLEKVFPFLGVRFVSVNDGYDSFEPACAEKKLAVILKNLVNEYVSKDTSVKVASGYAARQEAGAYDGGCAPYGYAFADKRKQKFVAEEGPAEIVKEIFAWTLEGDSAAAVVKKLTRMGVNPPKAYRDTGLLYWDGKQQRSYWSQTTVKHILGNMAYAGHMALHKWKSSKADGRKPYRLEETEWKVTQNAHRAIIPEEDFLQVQEILQKRRKKNGAEGYGVEKDRAEEYGAEKDRTEGYGAEKGRAEEYGAEKDRAEGYGAEKGREEGYGAEKDREEGYGAEKDREEGYGAEKGRVEEYGAEKDRTEGYGAEKDRAQRHGTENHKAGKDGPEPEVRRPPNLLKGKVFCGDCRIMAMRMGTNYKRKDGKIRIYRYRCRTYQERGVPECKGKSVSEKRLGEVVYQAIFGMLTFTGKWKEGWSGRQGEEAAGILGGVQRELHMAKDRIRQGESAKMRLYLEYRNGCKEGEDSGGKKAWYFREKRKQEDEIYYWERRKKELEEREEKLKELETGQGKRINEALAGGLDAQMAAVFVEKIFLYDGKRVEIVFAFQDAWGGNA